MFFRKLKGIFIPALLFLVLIVASILLFNFLLQNQTVQAYLLGRFSNVIGYELTTGTMNVSLWGGIGVTAHDLEAKSLTGPEKIFAARIKITLDTGKLLKGRIVPTRVFLFRPHIELAAEKDRKPHRAGQAEYIKEIFSNRLISLSAVSMEKGRISLKDIPFELSNLNLSVSRENDDPFTHYVDLRGRLGFGNKNVSLSLRGTITHDREKDAYPFANVTVKTGNIPFTWVPWPPNMKVEKGAGELIIGLKGRLGGPVSAKGKISSQDLCFRLTKGEAKKDFLLPQLTLYFESVYAKSSLDIPTLRLEAPDFLLIGDARVDFGDRANPHLAVNIKGPYMTLEAFKEIFPAQLLPTWFEKRLFLVLAGGQVGVDLFSLKGSVSQIRNLKLPENAKSLSIRLRWKDLALLRKEAPLPFKEVSGTLEVKNGALRISRVKGGFGKSIVKSASLNIPDLFNGGQRYDISAHGLFELKDLLGQGGMELIPGKVREQINKFKSASGNLDARVLVKKEKDDKYPRIRKGELLFRDCSFDHADFLFPVLLGEARIEVDGGGKSQFAGTGLWGNSLFETNGLAGPGFETIKANIVSRGDMNEIVDLFLDGDKPVMKFSQFVPCQITLEKKEGVWTFQGEIDPKGIILETSYFSLNPHGDKVRVKFSGNFQPGKKVELTQLRSRLGNSSLELSGSYDLGSVDWAHFRVKSPGLHLEDLGVRFGKGGSLVKGVIVCDTEVRTSLQNPMMTTIKGRMEGKGLSLAVSGIPSPIRDSFFHMRFSEKKAFIDFIKTKVGESTFNIKGELRGWDGLKGELMVNADYLDLSDFLRLFERNKSVRKGKNPEISRFLRQTDVTFALQAVRGRWRTLKYAPLKAEGAFRSGDFYVHRSRLQTDHGVVVVNGHVKRGQEQQVSFSSRIRLSGQPIQELTELLGIKEKYLDGLVTIDGVFSARERKVKDLISGLTGNAHFIVKKGTIRKSSVIFKVLDFLSLQKIFKQKPPDVSREGLYFETIGGNLSITNGIIFTENLIMKSPVFNAAAQGTVDIPKKWVDFDLGVQPLGTIDSLVSKIPIVGYILTGKKKTLLVYYFKVNGPLPRPEVRYIPLKNLGSSVVGFIKRVFFTPERLLEELAKITNAISSRATPLPEEKF